MSLALRRMLVHVEVVIRSVTSIMFAASLQSDQLLDEVDGHLRLLGKRSFHAVADVGPGSVECQRLVECWIAGCEVVVLFETTVGSGRDKEVTHHIGSVRVCVDVFETVSWAGHVLLGVVAANGVHDWVNISMVLRREELDVNGTSVP